MNLLSSQALLAIRLCGSVLDQEQPSARTSLASNIWELMEKKGITISVVHYNALLRVHLENGHKFEPDQVLAEMNRDGITPDKETFLCLISRHCQEGDTMKAVQMMKSSGIKVNENIFNSLIMGHGEAGDLVKANDLLKVMRTNCLD